MTTRITALEARHRLRRRHLELRAMDRLLEGERFDEVMKSATDDQAKELEVILKSDDAARLKAWMKKAANKPIDEKSLRELHIIARDLSIPKYSRLTRAQLIKAIERTTNATGMG